MSDRKLQDELKKLVSGNIISGFYDGTKFTHNGGNITSDKLILTNNQPSDGFVVWSEADDKWVFVGSSESVVVRQNIINQRRKRYQETTFDILYKCLIAPSMSETYITFYNDTSGSLNYFYYTFYEIFNRIKELLTPIYGDRLNDYVKAIDDSSERWIYWMTPEHEKEIKIAFINESVPGYHEKFSEEPYDISETFITDFQNFKKEKEKDTVIYFKGLIYAIEPQEGFDQHIALAFSTYNLQSYNLSYRFKSSGISGDEVYSDFKSFISESSDYNKIFLIEKNKTKTIQLPDYFEGSISYFLENKFIGFKFGTNPNDNKYYKSIVIYKNDNFYKFDYPNVPSTKLTPNSWRKEFWQNYLIKPEDEDPKNIDGML
ncbi:hypothetical protein [Scytonema sp. NUACC26]|uniref:hypothetical protein n=1 Tax=Scytonema sp. NUACC26 TaxID=3140176 RepID=UPI0034DC9DB2